MFKEVDTEDDEIVYQRDLLVYLKCLNQESLEDRKVFFWSRKVQNKVSDQEKPKIK